MNRASLGLAGVGMLSLIWSVNTTGCQATTDNCAVIGTCCPDGTMACLADAGGGGSSGGHDGGTTPDGGPGPDSGPAPGCIPSENSKVVADSCGVFVSSADGDDTNTGTSKKAPLRTLGAALKSGKTTIYACAGATPFSEAVVVGARVTIHGALDCGTWAYDATTKTQLTAPADSIPVTLTSAAANTGIYDFAITAASPSNMKGGGSSIAVAVDNVAVTLERCDVNASDAADGVNGMTPSGAAMKGADGAKNGDNGAPSDACSAMLGGAPGSTTCDDGATTGGRGGKGGGPAVDGGVGAGEIGAPGEPMDAGKGQGGPGAPDAVTDCTQGSNGAKGTNGSPGFAGSPSDDAVLLTGITNASNTDGKPGTKGQGGGGGGGALSGLFCTVNGSTVAGNGGGGGGAGGCGGKGGGGGKAGGSSIGILSLGTNLTLIDVKVMVGTAGKGGSCRFGRWFLRQRRKRRCRVRSSGLRAWLPRRQRWSRRRRWPRRRWSWRSCHRCRLRDGTDNGTGP